jgi:hypothetical protein
LSERSGDPALRGFRDFLESLNVSILGGIAAQVFFSPVSPKKVSVAVRYRLS